MSSESEQGKWVIRKHGVFFRPKARGYTESIWEAGLYSYEEAKKYLYDERVTIYPLSDVVNESMLNTMQLHLKKMQLSIGKEVQKFDFKEKGFVIMTFSDGSTERMARKEMGKYVFENVRYFKEIANEQV